MSVWEIIISVVLILASVIIIGVVLLQQGRQANIGAISGAAESFMDKGAAKTLNQRLAKFTKFIAVSFFVLVLIGMILTNFVSGKDASAGNDGSTSTTVSTTTTEATAETTTTAAAAETTVATTTTAAVA